MFCVQGSHLGFPRLLRARDKLLAQVIKKTRKAIAFLVCCAPTWARTRDPQIMSLML